MTLQTGNDQVRFKPKPLERSDVAQGQVDPKLLVLDGQQRLTSLSQALWGDGVAQTFDNHKKLTTRKFFIDLEAAVKDPRNLDAAVLSLPGDGIVRENFDRDIKRDVSTRAKQLSEGLFPFNLVFRDEGTSWLFDYSDAAKAREFLNSVLTPMKSYAIPSIELDDNTTKEAVATVFEKVNQGGMRLTVFELLTAKFAGDGDYYTRTGNDFRLKDDWEKTREIIQAHPVLKGIEETEFLQAVMLLTSEALQSATTAKKQDILGLTLENYLEWADEVREAIKWVSGFLDSEHIHTSRDVPYPTQLVPLAVLRVLLGEDIDVHGTRAKIRQWFWCGVMGELYSSATESRMARDIDQVPIWALQNAAAQTPRTVDDAVFVESRLHTLKTRNSAAYKGIYALLMANDTRDWLQNQPFDRADYLNLAVDIHHIFPKAWCIKNDINPTLRESIVNKTPLARKTNQMVGGVSPATYMKRLDEKAKIPAADLDRIVAAHQIDVPALRSADFDTFFALRRDALLVLIETATGKPAGRDIDKSDGTSAADSATYVDEPDDSTDDDSDFQ